MKSTSLLLLVATSAVATAQGFYSVCSKTYSLGYRGRPSFVVATCPGSDDANITSTIDLNDCLTNKEGVLMAQKLGNAFDTCSSCVASATNSSISCHCKQTNGKTPATDFDLNTVIANNNGIIECFQLPGIQVASDAI